MIRKILFFVLFFYSIAVNAQKDFNAYRLVYPIGEDPNIRGMSSYRLEETILFEANPTVRFSLYNNIVKNLMNDLKNAQKPLFFRHPQAWYFAVRPQFRMYNDNSKPVKMPSYRVLLGTQHLFRLPKKESQSSDRFLGFSLESGHYSNGQSGCSFCKDFDDATVQCDSVYNTITTESDLSALLNRTNANFSTNLTELILNYRSYKSKEEEDLPSQMHSVNLGFVLYHNRFLGALDFGGYTKQDIEIYGRLRYLPSYEYMRVITKKGARLTFRESLEIIQDAHPHVEPVRNEFMATYYPFPEIKELGLFISYIYGHDNYNFRFVDSGHQVSLGLSWSQFPPLAMDEKL